MTPAIKLAEQAKTKHHIHQYQHDPKADSYGLEACDALNLPAEQVFKTLVVELDNKELAVAVVPVAKMLSTKQMAKALSAKKAIMADKQAVTRSTGYVLGGVSPLGQKKKLRTVIDASAQTQTTIYVSAGKRGLEIELAPNDLAELCSAEFAAISQY